MLISDKMLKALNHQVTNELSNNHSYLAMAYNFDHMGLKVLAQRFFQQAEEERVHAMKIARYISDLGARVHIEALPKPQETYETALAAVESALKAELTTTDQIYKLVAQAEAESDYATRSFLKWFVDEQVEEVSTMNELVQWVTMAGEDNLLQLETRLAQAMGSRPST